MFFVISKMFMILALKEKPLIDNDFPHLPSQQRKLFMHLSVARAKIFNQLKVVEKLFPANNKAGKRKANEKLSQMLQQNVIITCSSINNSRNQQLQTLVEWVNCSSICVTTALRFWLLASLSAKRVLVSMYLSFNPFSEFSSSLISCSYFSFIRLLNEKQILNFSWISISTMTFSTTTFGKSECRGKLKNPYRQENQIMRKLWGRSN